MPSWQGWRATSPYDDEGVIAPRADLDAEVARPCAGAEVAGLLPAPIQFYFVSTGAVATNSKVDEGGMCGDQVPGHAAAVLLRIRGLEPG